MYQRLVSIVVSALFTVVVAHLAVVAEAHAAVPNAKNKIGSDCTFKGKKLYGKVQIVTSGADFKVKKVGSFADLKIQEVRTSPRSCGKWKFVKSSPDFTIQYVKSFPDFSIKRVSSFPGVSQLPPAAETPTEADEAAAPAQDLTEGQSMWLKKWNEKIVEGKAGLKKAKAKVPFMLNNQPLTKSGRKLHQLKKKELQGNLKSWARWPKRFLGGPNHPKKLFTYAKKGHTFSALPPGHKLVKETLARIKTDVEKPARKLLAELEGKRTSSQSGGGEATFKPEHHYWAKWKPGTTVSYRFVKAYMGRGKKGVATETLMAVGNKSYKTQVVISGKRSKKKKTESKHALPKAIGGEKVTVEGKEYDCVIWEWQKQEGFVSATHRWWVSTDGKRVLKAEVILGGAVELAVESMDEVVKVGSEEVHCVKLHGTAKLGPLDWNITYWINLDFPGGIVKKDDMKVLGGRVVREGLSGEATSVKRVR